MRAGERASEMGREPKMPSLANRPIDPPSERAKERPPSSSESNLASPRDFWWARPPSSSCPPMPTSLPTRRDARSPLRSFTVVAARVFKMCGTRQKAGGRGRDAACALPNIILSKCLFRVVLHHHLHGKSVLVTYKQHSYTVNHLINVKGHG